MRMFLNSSRRLLTAIAVAAAVSVAARLAAQEPPAAATPAPLSTASLMFAPGVDSTEVIEELVLPDTPLEGVLQLLERLTGRIVLRPQTLPTPQISINARQPLSRAEAVFAVETLLSLNGIGLVAVDEKFLKVVPIANIRTEAPELVVGSLRDEPASGKVVSKLFRLQYLDSASFQQQVAPFLSAFGSVVPFQNSNAVIVTDTIANLQRLEYVVTEVDRRLSIETKFYQIRYASAPDLAEAIRATIESARAGLGGSQSGRASSAGPAVAMPVAAAPGAQPVPAVPGAPGGVPLQVVFSSITSINADERTNQLIVITDPASLPFFDNLIERLDIPADPPTSIEVIPMKHADAVELASLLSQFVSGRSQSASRGSGRSGASGSRERGTPFPALQTTPAASPPTERQQAVQSAVESVTEGSSQFSDFMTIIADERSNAIVASGTNNDLALIKKVIDRLDVILAQVRLEVVIAEVTLSNNWERGIDAFGFTYDANAANGGWLNLYPQSGPIGPLEEGEPLIGGIFRAGTLREIGSINALIRAVRGNADVNLLSVPTIMTTHNKEATIIVGEARPIVTSTQQSNSGGVGIGSYSSFQFQDIALELKVKPTIGPNDVVQLEIDQKVDAVTDFTVINGEDQPVIGRRQATSYISARNGQLIVLGGLQKTDTTKRKSRMFLLGEIPIVGEIFSRTTNDRVKTELLLFIKPTVVRNTDEADADARKAMGDYIPNLKPSPIVDQVTGNEPPPPEPETPAKVNRPRPGGRR